MNQNGDAGVLFSGQLGECILRFHKECNFFGVLFYSELEVSFIFSEYKTGKIM